MTLLLKFKIKGHYNTHDICVFQMANGINSSVHSMSGNVKINRTIGSLIFINETYKASSRHRQKL